jgi:hypothetical protein
MAHFRFRTLADFSAYISWINTLLAPLLVKYNYEYVYRVTIRLHLQQYSILFLWEKNFFSSCEAHCFKI